MQELDLQKITFFTEGNTYAGERVNENGIILRYRVKPDKENDVLIASAWHKDVCFECAEIAAEKSFALSEKGLAEIQAWLQEQLVAC